MMSLRETLAARLGASDLRTIEEVEREIVDELEFHMEMLTQANLREGMPEKFARAAALDRFGNFERIQEKCRRTLLGERIMLQRVQVGLMLLLVAGIAVMGVQMYAMQHTNRLGMQHLIASLGTIGTQMTTAEASEQVSTYDKLTGESPVVVSTFPEQGALDADPSITEIRVTFHKPMQDRSWSWCQISAETFPETAGEPRYSADRKTCVLPVKLEGGKRYCVRFNSENHDNFRDESNRPAVPYTLAFETRH